MTTQHLMETRNKAKSSIACRVVNQGRAQSSRGTAGPIYQLQRFLGNRGVAKLIRTKRLLPSGQVTGLQRKSNPAGAHDRHESEPDRVARQVVRASNAHSAGSMQASAGTRSESGGGAAMEEGKPDWSAPIEQEADTRSERREGGRTVPGLGASSGAATLQRQAAPAAPAAPAAAVFPTFQQVRWNATVSSAMWSAWAETLRAATATTRREQGFWVQWDSTTIRNANGGMRIVGAVTAPTIGPTVTASVNLGARPADAGNWVTVASFHTHTPTRFRPVGRVVGPSGADLTADTNDNVTGLVYDYTAVAGGAIPTGHPIWSAAQVYHSGPNSRV